MGVDLGAGSVRAVVLDLAGHVAGAARAVLAAPADRDRIRRQVLRTMQSARRAARLSGRDRLLGVGFAVPGFLDRRAGLALEASYLPGLKNAPVRRWLEDALDTPAAIEESTRAMALGELWFGLGREAKDFVCLDLGYGVGVGIISNGRLHRGASETGGEIGHTTVCSAGTLCRCGKRGCLETVASGEAIGRLSGKDSAEAAAAAAKAGNARAARVIRQAGRYLGIAAANLINLLNPALVVLNGGLCAIGRPLLDAMERSLTEHAVGPSLTAARIEVSPLGDLAGAMGAATLMLGTCFEPQEAPAAPTGSGRASRAGKAGD